MLVPNAPPEREWISLDDDAVPIDPSGKRIRGIFFNDIISL